MNNIITPEIFNQELKPILAELDSRLSRKAEEYATQDRYHNFVQSGIELNDVGLDVQDSTLFSIFALMTKHFVSVKDMLKDIQNGNDDFTSEYADEKFGDLICYLLLMQVYVKQNYTKQGADKQEKRQRIIEELIQDIDDMSEELNDLGTLHKDVLIDDAIRGFKDNPIVDNPLPIMQTISFKNPNHGTHKFEFKGLETANNYSSERLEKLEKILEKASPLPAQNVSFTRADMNRAKALKNSPCAACNLAECERDCEHNILPSHIIANGWHRFLNEFCKENPRVSFLARMLPTFKSNKIVLNPKDMPQRKELADYLDILDEKLAQFYNADIKIEVVI